MKTEAPPTYGGRLWPELPDAPEATRDANDSSVGSRMMRRVFVAVIAITVLGAGVVVGSRAEPSSTPDPIDAAVDSPAPRAEAVTAYPVRELRATEEAWVVHLKWSPPRGPRPDQYEVLRDGRVIAHSASTSLDDDSVLPGSKHSYSVIAVSISGDRSKPVRVSSTVAEVPRWQATLAGTYSFEMHETSQYGYRAGVYKGTFWVTLSFDPTCQSCSSVSFHDTDYPDVKGTMHRTSSGFQGSAIGDWGVTCGKKPSTSHFSWDVTVLDVSPDDSRDLLVADDVSATLQVTEPATNGCRASGVTFEGTA